MAFDSKRALNHAIKYLTESAHQRAAGGWIPPKEEERRKKEAAKSEEKQQKLLSKQFPTHYMPNVGRQVMAKGGTPQTDLGGDIITRKLATPTEFMRGMDLEANVPQFAAGAPQLTPPQSGGAPPAQRTVTLQDLSAQAGMTPKEYGERFTALKKPATPFEEWRYTETANAPMRERQVFDVSKFKPGDVIVPFVGDLTSAGKRISNINDIKMANPLITEGGESYMRSTPDIWASGKSIISGIYNKANDALAASRKAKNVDPVAYGIHVGMAPVAGDFSTHTAEGILGLLPSAKILNKDIKKFDQFMRTPSSESPGFKDWPGLKSDKLYDYLMAQNAGKARIKFSKGMDKAEWRDLGFPDVGPVRFASTEQMIGGMPTGTSGLSIGRIASENAISKNPESIHRSYPVSLKGTYVGGLSIPLARDIIFKDWSDRFDANAPARNFESAKNKSYANKEAYQLITNKWLDMIHKELEAARNKKAYGGSISGNQIDSAKEYEEETGKVHPDLKMDVPVEDTKERMSNMRADVPVRWASSPDHPSAHLAYITDAEAELLKKADLHNSNIAHEHHVGPGGIPSYQGGGIGSGGSTNTSGGPGSAPGGDGSTSGSSGMGAGTGNISSSGGGGGGGGAAITTGGGGGGGNNAIGGGGGGGGMGIGLGSVNAFGSPGNMGTFGSTDPGQQADQSMVDALSSNMSLGANLGSSLVQEAVTPDLSGGSDIMSPQNLGIQNGVLMGGITPAAYGRMQSQPQMLQAMGIAGAPTTAADLSLAAQAARLGDIPGAAQAEAAPKPEAVNPITGATTPGGQALSETQWSNLGKPWAQAATDIANWIGAGFKTPEVPAPAPQPSVPFVKEQGAAPGSPSASITPQGTGLSGFEAALGTTPTATGQINVPNAGDLYAASNAPLAVNQQSAPSTSTPQSAGMQDPSQAAYAEQMAKSAREAWLAANTEPESPRLGDLATPTPNRPFATLDRAGSVGSMPIGMTPRTADLTAMSSQPARPITPTPFSTFPQDVQRQMIPNRPDSAFGQTLVDPTGEQTQQALGNMEIAENGLALLQNPIVRMFMPTPTPATPEQQSAIERMYQRDLNSGVPSDFATPEGMLSRYGYPTGTTPDRAGSMGSMPSGTMQYASDLTPMSNQPARPITPTPSTAYPTSSPQVQQQQQSSQTKTGVPEYSSSLQPSQTIRQNFEQAFADARAKNAPTFYWTNPATGERTLYTTQLGRKEGGRVPSLSNPDDWVAKPSKVTAPSKKTSSRKPSKIDGTAIVRRALMLSSRKS